MNSSSFVTATTDRRTQRRARIRATVTIAAPGMLVDATGADVSTGGMRVFARRALRTGTRVSLVFFLHGDLVSANAVVRWSRATLTDHYEVGLSFGALEDDERTLIARFCKPS